MTAKVPEVTIVQAEDVALSYHYMEKYFRIAVNLNAVPFSYDKLEKRFSLDRGGLKYKLWMLLMPLGMLVETAQVTWELIRGCFDEGVGRGEWSLVLFLFISWSFITSMHFSVYWYGEDMVSYVNQALGMREHFKESNLPETSDHKVVKAHMYLSCGQCFFQALMVASEGLKPQYLFSNVPEEYRSPVAWGLWVPYAYYRVMSNFQSGYFQLFVGMLHNQTCNQILIYRRQTKESTEECVKSYRMVQILSKMYNFAFASTFVPFITLFAGGNIILGNYGTLRFTHELEFNLYANFPLMTGMMLLLVFTFYPSNAAMKEMSDEEGTKMLFSCLNLEDVLEKLREGETLGEPKHGVEPVVAPKAFEGVGRMRKKKTLVISSREDEAIHDFRKLEKFGGAFQRKAQEMLEKVRRYHMARALAKSCPCVSVRMAGLYPIKRSTVLTIFDFIWTNTISALLTWK